MIFCTCNIALECESSESWLFFWHDWLINLGAVLSLCLCPVCLSLLHVCLQMRLTSLVASTATAMITAAWRAWVAMDMAAPTVAALVSLWTIPHTMMTSDTQPGDTTVLTGIPPCTSPLPPYPPCPPLQGCSQPDSAVQWPTFFSWQICFGLRCTYLHVLSWSGKSLIGNVDDKTLMELEGSQNQRGEKKHTKKPE